jgi:hypothetical protein
MKLYARHGDLIVNRAEAFSGGVQAVNLVLVGKDNPHTVLGPVTFLVDGPRTRFSVAEPTELVHSKTHVAIPIPAGNWVSWIKRERGDGQDRLVDD